MSVQSAEAERALVRVCDLAGRPRGTGFLAEAAGGCGTLVTSHEAVDGLVRLVLHAWGEQTILVEADAITPLPALGLALVAVEGLEDVPPLPVAAAVRPGKVRLRGRAWTDAEIVGTASVTYTATDRFHLLDEVHELAAREWEPGPEVSGTPVLDPGTGAVLGVVVTALHAGHRADGFAVPLRGLGELLERNAATVPAYGAHLNLAGALQLTATSVGSAGAPHGLRGREPVVRPETEAVLRAFAEGGPGGGGRSLVLGLVGDPGCGRTTELAALAVRRATGAEPAPTLWLRGAELHTGDGGLKDAVERSLRAAGRIVHAGAGPGDAAPVTSPDAVAHLAEDAGRPLLVVLDGPEEMPPVLAHSLPDWVAGTASWLRAAGVRLVVACRPEFWEQAGALFPRGVLHDPGRRAGTRALPACVRLGDLPEPQAGRARERYGVPEGALTKEDGAHPLALRLLSEVRAALPEGPADGPGGRPDRAEVFGAYLDLVCLRIAVRLAADGRGDPRGTAVRRLAARVAGRAHEAARRCLGPGQGELDRESFEELFPWRTGWASAVLTEGLVVPAGAGYRFAHEEFADWLQGGHLELDQALYALVHRWSAASPPGGTAEAPVRLPSRPPAVAGRGGTPPVPLAPPLAPPSAPRSLPVPRHRIGPVVQSLLVTDRRCGAAELARRLEDLVLALDGWAAPPAARGGSGRPLLDGVPRPRDRSGASPAPGPQWERARRADAVWWAAHLLGEALLRVPDVLPYRGVLRLLAERITARSIEAGGFREGPGLGRFGPWFWRRLRLPLDERLALLRQLLPADAPPQGGDEERFLTAAGEELAAAPREALPAVCAWFADERPLQSAPGGPRPTVATAAQALLHTHRHRAVDDLTETLVAAAHPRADELLAALAEDEPAAVCRAVDRWAHDGRPERHVAAAAYGLRTAPHVTVPADRRLLRYAALAILARPADCTLHGAALAVLVRDPATRSFHLPAALDRFAAGDPRLPADALATALATHPDPVLAAFHTRLREPGGGGAEVLRALAEIGDQALARRVAALVRDHLEQRPEGAAHVAEYLDRRLEDGPGVRAVLLPLTVGLLREHPAEVRRALAPVLAAPGGHSSRPLRRELLDALLERERDHGVLDALLTAAAGGCALRPAPLTRDLVHRVGVLLCRSPEGATLFDRRLVQLAAAHPGFARQVRGWLAADGGAGVWDTLVGPSARRAFDRPAADTPPARAPEATALVL
ncbi:serine protease [Streptomyces sp. MI02-7b]|uniref:serine protease n=1 Tax=Streptomyces sp. MI02-7b TaxID=462941 RepID=UPI0029ACF6EC|nr:serine protease [Streptomyces sp. MI02-7b]MDX3077939.1 serine protease [Streptomyces sp. MI02-7b]